jgi:hypothetical protein
VVWLSLALPFVSPAEALKGLSSNALYGPNLRGFSTNSASYVICVVVSAWLVLLVLSDFPQRYITGFS